MHKLIRDKIPEIPSFDGRVEKLSRITQRTELQRLYALKIKEEFMEIKETDFEDLEEVADLYEVYRSAIDFFWGGSYPIEETVVSSSFSKEFFLISISESIKDILKFGINNIYLLVQLESKIKRAIVDIHGFDALDKTFRILNEKKDRLGGFSNTVLLDIPEDHNSNWIYFQDLTTDQ